MSRRNKLGLVLACAPLVGCAAPTEPTSHPRATPTFDASVHGASGLDFVGPSLDHAVERRQIRADREERRRSVRRSDPVLVESDR